MASIWLTSSVTLATITLSVALLWLLSLAKRDASIVDPFWGCGFAIVALVAVWLNSPPSARTSMLAIMTAAWGLRLSLFLFWRNWGHGEDRRYQAMRDHHGPRFWWASLFTVFLLQAVILWFVSLPIQVATIRAEPSPLGWLDALGCFLWAIGLTFESIGDLQLARFNADPDNTGRVMDRGLWKFTRHPNYFGDFCVWWGLYFIAASGGAWWTVASPLLMSFLLMKVSGVTLLERSIVERRPNYAEYQTRTNAFFPGPPRERRVRLRVWR
jgi:steroid 5-alpha reductase family enzyme